MENRGGKRWMISINKEGYEPAMIVIYDRKNNKIYREISLLAFDKRNNKVMGVGNDIIPLQNSVDESIVVISPLKNGMIADYTAAFAMFQGMFQKVSLLKKIMKPKIAVCVPNDITEVEKKAFFDIFYQIGAKKVFISEESAEELNRSLSESYNVMIEIEQTNKEQQIDEERWHEVYSGKIPEGIYKEMVTKSYEAETIITISNEKDQIDIKFYGVIAMQMLDKRIVLADIHSKYVINQINNNKNIIYEVEKGGLVGLQKKVEKRKELGMETKQYVLILETKIIEVFTEREPEIVVG